MLASIVIWYASGHSRSTGTYPLATNQSLASIVRCLVPYALRYGRPLRSHHLRSLCSSQLQEPCTGLYSGMFALSIVTHNTAHAIGRPQRTQRSKRGQRPHLFVVIIAVSMVTQQEWCCSLKYCRRLILYHQLRYNTCVHDTICLLCAVE